MKPKWDDRNYLKAYELALSGMNDTKIAEVLGVSYSTFKYWKDTKPAFKEALEKAKSIKNIDPNQAIKDHIFGKLCPELRDVWNKICNYENMPRGCTRLEALLKGYGKTARQHLFLYALVNANYNLSEACKKVNIPKHTFKVWKETDPDFAELVDEIEWHKGNLYESALVDLVKQGDTSATIFANKTFNKQRGYGEKLEIKSDSTVTHHHLHVHVKIDDLKLPIETRKQILLALRESKQPNNTRGMLYMAQEAEEQ